MGVLVKGGAALEALGTIRNLALDKTGTLTRNQPVIVEVATTGPASPDQVLAVPAALEARSEHPWPEPSSPQWTSPLPLPASKPSPTPA